MTDAELNEIEGGHFGHYDARDIPRLVAEVRRLQGALADATPRIATLMTEVARLRAALAGRSPGCRCQWEAGDSSCPVHGEVCE